MPISIMCFLSALGLKRWSSGLPANKRREPNAIWPSADANEVEVFASARRASASSLAALAAHSVPRR